MAKRGRPRKRKKEPQEYNATTGNINYTYPIASTHHDFNYCPYCGRRLGQRPQAAPWVVNKM